MRNAAIIALCAITLASCYGGPAGEVVGVYPREDWVQVNPYGMNYIHYGSYTMGPSDQDVPYALTSRSKTVTIPAFYIDIHEISNNEYRRSCAGFRTACSATCSRRTTSRVLPHGGRQRTGTRPFREQGIRPELG